MMQYGLVFRMNQQRDIGFEPVYDQKKELERQCLDRGRWRVSTIGRELSEFLPDQIVVPAEMSDETLRSISKFRADGRVPHIVYHHPRTRAVICRSGEPLIGLKNARCVEDEEYTQILLRSQSSSLPAVIDARTKSYAGACKTRGGGSEADGNYPNIRMFFTNIDQPVAIRETFQRFLESTCSVAAGISN